MVRAEALLHAAVADNARWCDIMCGSHGHPGVFTGRVWISAGHTVPFYPNAVTMSPRASAAETGAGLDPSRPYSVKDSFARLDLAIAGLAPLFDAHWIAFPGAPAGPPQDGLSRDGLSRDGLSRDGLSWDAVTDAAGLAEWEAAWAGGSAPAGPPLFRPELLADPRCVILACRRDGALVAGTIACTAGEVTGISNVFGAAVPAGTLWASALRAVAVLRPGLPVVGYEHGAGLAAAREAGCQVLGPLRVWARGLAP